MNKMKKLILLLASIALVACVVIGASLAYLSDQEGPLTNEFTPTEVTCQINEDAFDGTEKNNVAVTNTSDNVNAYIRVAIVMNWLDANNNVAPVSVEADDYEMQFNGVDGYNSTDWTKRADGYYYYKSVVDPGDMTSNLFDSLIVKEKNGYKLQVDIIADAVQAEPAQAVTDAWGFVPGA